MLQISKPVYIPNKKEQGFVNHIRRKLHKLNVIPENVQAKKISNFSSNLNPILQETQRIARKHWQHTRRD